MQALLDNDPDYIVTVDRDGKILSVNRTVADFNVDSVVGSTIYDYQPPEFLKTSRTMLRRVFEDGQVVAMETFGGLDPNSERYVRVRAVPLTIDGQIESALLIGTDITEQKKSAKKLNSGCRCCTRLPKVRPTSCSSRTAIAGWFSVIPERPGLWG